MSRLPIGRIPRGGGLPRGGGARPRPVPRPTAGPTPGPTPEPTPGPIPGTTFTLTTNIETVPPTGALPALSTVNGVIATTGSTYQTGDIINANLTSDVKITVANGGVSAAVVAINNAGSVQFRNVAGANQDVNAVLFSGVAKVGSFGSLGNSDITIANGDINSTYVLSNPAAQGAGAVADLTVGFLNATGTTDTAKFEIAGVGFSSATAGTTNASLTVTGNTAEGASVVTSGVNYFRPTIGTAATTLNVSGSGTNFVTLASGDLTNNAKTVSFASATGANKLTLGSFVRAGDTYTGGSGADVLGITPSGLGATALNVSSFETLELTSGAAAGTLGFATTPGFAAIDVLSASTVTGGISLLNAGSIPTLNFKGDGVAGGTKNFSGLTAPSSGTVAVNFSNGGLAAGGYELGGDVVLNGATAINLSLADVAATTNVLTSDAIKSSTLVTFNASGSGVLGGGGAFDISAAATGAGNTLQSVNLSGLSSTSQSKVRIIDGSFVALTATAAPGGSEVTLGSEASTDVVTFNGGAGADVLDASSFAGLVNFTGGASGDKVTGNNGGGGIVFAQGGLGNDTLTGGDSADTLQGDADNDILQGNIGLDVLSGGTGVDSFRYDQSRTTDIDTITDFAFGSTGDNVGYTIAGGFTLPTSTTAVTLSTLDGTDISATSGSAVIQSFNGGASVSAGTTANFVVLTATAATSFDSAIGTNGLSVSTNFAANEGVAAVYFDSVNSQAVFGILIETSTAGTLNSSDTFAEVARASTTLTDFQSVATANASFF